MKLTSLFALNRVTSFAVLTIGLCLATSASFVRADTATFRDSTFNLANYSSTNWSYSPFSVVATTISTDPTGNRSGTGPALQINYDVLCGQPANPYCGYSGGYYAATGVLNSHWVYNPATEGAITGLHFSADLEVQSSLPLEERPDTVVMPFLYQDGKYYSVSDYLQYGVVGYQTTSVDIPLSYFHSYDFTQGVFGQSSPNYSSKGDPITFGFGDFVSDDAQPPGERNATNVFYDNVTWKITAPEPSSVELLGGGLVLLIVLGRLAVIMR